MYRNLFGTRKRLFGTITLTLGAVATTTLAVSAIIASAGAVTLPLSVALIGIAGPSLIAWIADKNKKTHFERVRDEKALRLDELKRFYNKSKERFKDIEKEINLRKIDDRDINESKESIVIKLRNVLDHIVSYTEEIETKDFDKEELLSRAEIVKGFINILSEQNQAMIELEKDIYREKIKKEDEKSLEIYELIKEKNNQKSKVAIIGKKIEKMEMDQMDKELSMDLEKIKDKINTVIDVDDIDDYPKALKRQIEITNQRFDDLEQKINDIENDIVGPVRDKEPKNRDFSFE